MARYKINILQLYKINRLIFMQRLKNIARKIALFQTVSGETRILPVSKKRNQLSLLNGLR